MKKVMLIYPAGEIYQRGEERCQINVEASVSNSLRACNDLGYCAAVLKQRGFEVFLKDYSVQKLSFSDFLKDFNRENPDILFISVTNGSIYTDLNFANKAKELKKDLVIILKGALFFNPEEDLFEELNLDNIDYLTGSETEFIIADLAESHFFGKENLKNIQGICYKDANGGWIVNKVVSFRSDLDSLPFPDRSLMRNELYVNPATNKPMATISTSRGCPSSCIFCISPLISGRTVRNRSAVSVFEELKECVCKFNICDFFFKSDTFTINRDWVIELCDCIINSELKGKINWVANSRVNTIDEEMLLKMKQAGCSVIALGLESGSDESLIRMKKGTSVEQNRNAVNLIKKVGLKIFGFYLVGFPWETREHLEQTKKLIFELDTDFIELSLATPFKGSGLYSMLCEKKLHGDNVLGKDSFKYLTSGTDYISADELKKFRKDVLLKYHIRPSYILKKLSDKNITFDLFINYIKYGIRLLRNIFS